MNFFHHKELGNHLLQLWPKVMKHPVYFMFVALGIQHAMHVRHIFMWPSPPLQYFPHYLINGTIFKKKNSY